MPKVMKADKTIKAGDFVKSYDFPDNLRYDPARAETCYFFGEIEQVLTREEAAEIHFELGSCPRYKIRVLTRVWDSQVVEQGVEYVYPPVNGTPTWGNGDNGTYGVVRIEA